MCELETIQRRSKFAFRNYFEGNEYSNPYDKCIHLPLMHPYVISKEDIIKQKYSDNEKILNLFLGYPNMGNIFYNKDKVFLLYAEQFFNKEESRIIKYVDGSVIDLPSCLNELAKEIEESKRLLEYKDNWDGEGAKAIDKRTLINSIEFIVKYSKWIWEKNNIIIKTPNISPGPNGSIDLYWNSGEIDFLINIPEYPGLLASFYGDNQDDQKIEGKFNIKKDNPGIFLSLLELI